MRQLLVLAAVAGLALSRPESYREKEDFQFSRTSSDEGSKSGFYGAQRGNMGGNYERAHNMDHIAQNQMSGLVRNVEGDLGDGAQQTRGSVYTAASSRGVYGSGNYDLSNLEGRDFREGTSHGSQSHSSLSSHQGSAYNDRFSSSSHTGFGSSQYQNSGYGSSLSHSRSGGYNSAGDSEQALYSNRHHQASGNLQSEGQYEDRSSAQNSGYHSQAAGYQGSGIYDQGRTLTHNSDGSSNIRTRLVNGSPVRILVRPGTTVNVPIAAQTYDASQSASTFDQSAINSETEVGNDQQAVLRPKPKHYESSYSYRKEWEKHDTKPLSGVVPLVIPTVNPYPVNSELYDDAQAQTLEQQRLSASGSASQSHHSSHSGYNVNTASTSQSRHADQLQSLGSNVDSTAYHGGSDGAYNAFGTNNRRGVSGAYIGTGNSGASLNQIADSNTKPKSYQSSYSYHKSWERQGDPYIITPSTNGLYDGQTSGKLTATSFNQGAYGNSHQYGSHQSHSSHSNADCDENAHIRVARSAHSHHHQRSAAQTRGDVVDQQDFGQQTQQQWDNFESLDQQTPTRLDNIKQVEQQTQNAWDHFGQQTENQWGQQETQKFDFGQQSENQWDQHDVGQQTQNTWGNPEPQRQTELGQQTQETWTPMETGQETEETWTPLETESSANGAQKPRGQDNRSNENTFEIVQSSNDQTHNTESHTAVTGINKTTNHHVNTIWDEIKKEEIGQENEDTVESDLTQNADLGQQTQVSWGDIEQNENSFNPHQVAEDQVQGSTSSDNGNTFSDMPNPHPWMYNQVHHYHENSSYSNHHFAHSSSSSSFSGSNSHNRQQENSINMNTNSNNSNENMHSSGSTSGSSIMSLWDKLNNIEKQTITSQGNEDRESQHVGQGNADVFGSHVQHSVFDSTNTDAFVSNAEDNVFKLHTTAEPLQPNIASFTTPKPFTEPINTNDKVLPHDIGRGDIGAEDLSNEQNKLVNSKINKTPEEIETLSLTKETEKDNHDIVQVNNNRGDENLSVMSLDQQKDKEQSRSIQDGSSITTQQTLVHQFTNSQANQTDNTDQQQFDFGHQNENIGAEQMEQQFETQNIGRSESNQRALMEQETEGLRKELEEGFDQASVSGSKLNENLNQQEQEFGNWEQTNKNTDQQQFDIGQQSENIGAEQMEQQFETENIRRSESDQRAFMEQETEGLHEELEEGFDQASASRSKLNENLNQQEQKFGNWEQTDENTDQQPYDFGQQSENRRPEWLDNMEGQQVQTAWDPIEKLQQHSQLVEPQPVEDLNQQVQTAWQQTEDLQQQSQVTNAFTPHVDQNTENLPTPNQQQEVVEELIVPKKVTEIVAPPETETVTENPGFWKKVGSKFTNAKNTVASWFSSR